MSLKIYGYALNRTFRALWMAEELKQTGVEYEHKAGFFIEGEERELLLTMNPMGQSPTIDDDGFYLAESMAINLYLSKKHGVLEPQTLQQEAKTLQWSFWVMTSVEMAALDYMKYKIGIMGVEPDAEKAAEIASGFDRGFKVIDGQLAQQEYLVCDEFTVADLNVASVLFWIKMAEVDLSPYPALNGWLNKCLGRPAVARARALGDS